MKRPLVIGAAFVVAVLAAGGAFYGPEVIEGYRFTDNLEQHKVQYQANGGAWPQLQDTCTLCHGSRGQPLDDQYASLAGLPAAYLKAQLHAFAEGRRHGPTMSPLAASLSAEQINLLADYFSRQQPARTEAPASNATLEQQGKVIVTAKGCTACHGSDFSGGPLAPRIAGQGESYLLNQLNAFKQGQRQDPTQAMNALVSSLSDEELKAAAHYLAALAPANAPQ